MFDFLSSRRCNHRPAVRRQLRISWQALLSLLLGLALPPVAALAQPVGTSVATVQSVTSTPLLRRRGTAAFLPLRVRTSLYIGDAVQTGPNSRASLLFSDGSQVRLNANSVIEITTPAAVGRGRTSLFRAVAGEVWSRLRPNQAVQTPHAIAGVRGTEFDLKINPDNSTTLTVVEGEVEFYNSFGTVMVEPSQQSVARVDAPPSRPITVANSGLIIEWTADLERVVLEREKFFITLDRAALRGELLRRGEAAHAQPRQAKARLDYGDALFDARRFPEALAEYEAADALVPQQPETLARLGDVLLELGRLDEAELRFRAASADSAPERGPRLQTTAATLDGAETLQPEGLRAAPAMIGMAWLASCHGDGECPNPARGNRRRGDRR